MARLRIWSGEGEEMREDGSFEQSVEYARGKFTGMDCGVYDERGKSLSVIGLTRSETGVYVLPSAVTGVFLTRRDIEKSGVKVLSLEKCSKLRKFEIRAQEHPWSGSSLEQLTIILPNDNSLIKSVSISLMCNNFRLIGKCKGIDLTLIGCNELEIDNFVMENASSLDFSDCRGINSICLPYWCKLDSMHLLRTDTEYLSCHLRGDSLSLTLCDRLKFISLLFDKLDLYEFSGYMRSRLYNLEELHISVLKLFFRAVNRSDKRVVDLCYMSSILKRISFTAVDGFRVTGDGVKKYTLIVPSKAEFTMSKELEPYFIVVRK
jgi:hypothetical protein